MKKRSQQIQESLERCAFIIRKYHIGHKDYFYAEFSFLGESQLQSAWLHAIKKVSTHEIVKDTKILLSEKDDLRIKAKLSNLGKGSFSIFYYLKSEFDPKKLKLTDENIERRVRHLLAQEYIELCKNEFKVSIEYNKPTTTLKRQLKRVSIATGILGLFFIPRAIKGLTSVDVLANRIHEKSKYEYRVGAICNDGWKSSSTGRGTCSHHKGVREWVYETAYRKTMEECVKEAKKISWLD